MARASVSLHRQMLQRVLGSTMAFFDTTPVGRIVNRFSKDIDEVRTSSVPSSQPYNKISLLSLQVDIMIPMHIKDILNSLFSVMGTLFVICYASPIIIAFVVPMVAVFIFLQAAYLSASRYVV